MEDFNYLIWWRSKRFTVTRTKFTDYFKKGRYTVKRTTTPVRYFLSYYEKDIDTHITLYDGNSPDEAYQAYLNDRNQRYLFWRIINRIKPT